MFFLCILQTSSFWNPKWTVKRTIYYNPIIWVHFDKECAWTWWHIKAKKPKWALTSRKILEPLEPLSRSKYISCVGVLIQQSIEERISDTVSFRGSQWTWLHLLLGFLLLKNPNQTKQLPTMKPSKILQSFFIFTSLHSIPCTICIIHNELL